MRHSIKNGHSSSSSTKFDNISVSGSQNYRERGITLGTGYPTIASLGAVSKWGETLERPSSSIGLDFNGVQIGIENGNQFYWRYPVSKLQEYMRKSATFFNYNGTIVSPLDCYARSYACESNDDL